MLNKLIVGIFNDMNRHHWVRRLVAFCLGLFLTLIFTELTLRGYGWSLKDRYDLDRHVSERKAPGKFRIVAIGESTTQPAYDKVGRDISWPTLLKARLEASMGNVTSRKFVIINMGVGGVTSAILVDRLQKNFHRMQPDLIISMMGVNDSFVLRASKSLWFESFRTFRWLHWLFKLKECSQCFAMADSGADNEKNISTQPNVVNMKQKIESWVRDDEFDFKSIEEEIESSLSKEPIRGAQERQIFSYALYELANSPKRFGQPKFLESNRKLVFAAAKQAELAHASNRRDQWSLILYCLCEKQLGNTEKCAKRLREFLALEVIPSPVLLSTVVSIPEFSERERTEAFRRAGFDYSADELPIAGTQASYQRLGRLAVENKIPYIAMHYPFGSTVGLARLFSSSPIVDSVKSFGSLFDFQESEVEVLPEFKSVILAGNEKFHKVVNVKNENMYFNDLFGLAIGVRFGHASELGNQLLADTAFDTIMKSQHFIFK